MANSANFEMSMMPIRPLKKPLVYHPSLKLLDADRHFFYSLHKGLTFGCFVDFIIPHYSSSTLHFDYMYNAHTLTFLLIDS